MENKNTYTFWPDHQFVTELHRPWKLVTFVLGMAFLIYAALNFHMSDWDIGVSILMGGLAYFCAPWSAYIVYHAVRLRPSYWLFHIAAAVIVMFFVIDIVYWAYHSIMGNHMYRWENFFISMGMYIAVGVLWMYRGTFRELIRDILVWLRPTL